MKDIGGILSSVLNNFVTNSRILKANLSWESNLSDILPIYPWLVGQKLTRVTEV